MAKISRQVREIINVVIFLLVAGALVYFYALYPLGQTKTLFARQNIDEYDLDSLELNNDSIWTEAGLAADTFSVEADGLTTLACLYLTAGNDSANPVRGTAILLHSEYETRDSLLPLAKALLDASYNVAVYDQRASGYSTGKYHGEGAYEAQDLIELIRYLDLREKIVHPLTVVGFGIGAEATMLASLEEKRIDNVFAVDPYLTTDNLLDVKYKQHDILWFPIRTTIFWWWYDIRSSYAATYREISSIQAVGARTYILAGNDASVSEEFTTLKELSDRNLLEITTYESNPGSIAPQLLQFMAGE